MPRRAAGLRAARSSCPAGAIPARVSLRACLGCRPAFGWGSGRSRRAAGLRAVRTSLGWSTATKPRRCASQCWSGVGQHPWEDTPHNGYHGIYTHGLRTHPTFEPSYAPWKGIRRGLYGACPCSQHCSKHARSNAQSMLQALLPASLAPRRAREYMRQRGSAAREDAGAWPLALRTLPLPFPGGCGAV